MGLSDIQHKIKELVWQEKLTDIGFVNDLTPTRSGFFKDWVQQKKFAGMSFMARYQEQRLNPALLVKEFKVSGALVVLQAYGHNKGAESGVAQYAFGTDYHIWFKEKLNRLTSGIKILLPDFKARVCLDTAPLLERDLAMQAGLGFIGKNTCLIHPEFGSLVFIGVILHNQNWQVSPQPVLDGCETCRLCVEFCPTQALAEYRLEPIKCLAYQNIELRGARDPAYYKELGAHLVGCDICQEVCPWNKKPPPLDKAWGASFKNFAFKDLSLFLRMSESEYKEVTKNSAVSRVKHIDFMRNVFLRIANEGLKDLKPDIQRWQLAFVALPESLYCLSQLNSK